MIIDEESRSATVVVPDYQLSLAIGKEGQNVRLAARLCGWKIDIKSHTKYFDEEDAVEIERLDEAGEYEEDGIAYAGEAFDEDAFEEDDFAEEGDFAEEPFEEAQEGMMEEDSSEDDFEEESFEDAETSEDVLAEGEAAEPENALEETLEETMEEPVQEAAEASLADEAFAEEHSAPDAEDRCVGIEE